MEETQEGPSEAGPSADSSGQALVESCLEKSRQLLRRNLTPHGILAATPSEQAEELRYTRIFGRDAAICALAMELDGDEELRRGARASLLTLGRHQAANGQIPKYVDPTRQESDFWYVGCIDATLWWLIAVRLLARWAGDSALERELAPQVEKALSWLHCQEHPRLLLLQQNEASDWADIMPRSGFVLYTNALWYYVKRLYRLADADETKYHFNHLFYPFSNEVPDYRRLRLLTHYVRNRSRDNHLYLSFVNFSFWGEEGDVFGNLLAIVCGVADEGPANRIIDALEKVGVSSPYPVRVTCQPIRRSDPLWRAYMDRRRQNLEYRYHNGGIWPFVGGFWVLTLAQLGRKKRALDQLAALARANQTGNWEFNEWFHGLTGEPCGMAGQSWSAAMFLLAHRALERRVF
jgi:glycogen debranching enzyme